MSSDNSEHPPTTRNTGRDDPPPASHPSKTREDIINKWLKEIYIDYNHLGNPLALKIDEFIKIVATQSTDSDNSWLDNNALELASVILTNELKERSDIVIVPSSSAISLALIGQCMCDKDEFEKNDLSTECHAAMKKENVRWIVVPVTDGMISADKRSIPGGGRHWGFMIIDKQKNDARWLDGHLEVKKNRKGKWRITQMHTTGWVAGKILCGYEKVMNLKRGQFTAATLKYVPDDTEENSYKFDQGSACGPWVFAMLEYILDHPKFLTCADGLYGIFRYKHRQRHGKAMAFNSLASRKRIQEIIRGVADSNLGDDVLPYMLSTRILKILNYPSTVDLLVGINFFNRSKPPPPERGHNGNSEKGLDDDDNDDDNDDDDDDDDSDSDSDSDGNSDDDRENSDEANEDLQKAIQESFRSNKKNSAQGPQGTQVPTKSREPSKPPSKSPSSEQATFNVIYGVLLPEHIPNFEPMTSEEVQQWVDRLPSSIKTRTSLMNTWGQKAVLQKLFGGFDELSRTQLRSWREKAPLFKDSHSVEIEHVAAMLQDSVKDISDISLQGSMDHYPPSYLKDFAERNTIDQATLEAGTKLGNDNLDGEDGDDIFGYEDEAEENDLIPPQPKKPSEQASGLDTSIKRKHVKDNADAPAAKRLKPSRPDFLTMKDSELPLWLASVPEKKKAPLLDSGRKLIDPISARIYLECIFNGTFREWATEESFSETSRAEIKEWRKMVDNNQGMIKGLYPNNDAGLRNFLNAKLYSRKKIGLPDYSQDKAKWPEHWKKGKE
ncbi:hypothetical protein GT037_001297 [Alternaria burnsii]|uniref:Ubiquitin-like protease family profile domain-containing protein n=1 Tax=Alternaria burnsii TaxID=1187904 RepID=A0A8H7BHT1_9PLEO|nr:uncharacterized protein GT037_001297 [Alternaria burnsii]KAF7682321.1 hypothetical protein GT037_001297 [Alternaria burnsii]CAI9636313.1 unnamed protein product [Alternaria burnsii]